MLFYTGVIKEIAVNQKHFREVENDLTDIKLFFQRVLLNCSRLVVKAFRTKNDSNLLPFFHQSFFFSRREKRDYTGFKFIARIN